MPIKTSPTGELDLRSLAYAVLVLEHGSFSVAGQVLDVRTSVVSRRVRNLEDAIGVSLFDRSSKGVRATIAGERVLRRGRAILAEIDTLKQTAALNGRGAEGRLRLGVVASIAAGFARHLLISFLAVHPEVELEVVGGAAKENVAAVRMLTMDFTLVAGMPLSPGCEIEELWRERILVGLPEHHALAHHGEIAWQQLVDERFIVSRVDPGPEIQDYIIHALADLGRHPEVDQIEVQRETLLGLVGLGQGLSLVGEAEAGVIYPGVVFRPLDHEELPFSIVWSRQNSNPVFRRFLVAARLRAAERRASQFPR